MRTRDALIYMVAVLVMFILLFGWPSVFRYETTTDGRLVRISRITGDTFVLMEGQGWVPPQYIKPTDFYCRPQCTEEKLVGGSPNGPQGNANFDPMPIIVPYQKPSSASSGQDSSNSRAIKGSSANQVQFNPSGCKCSDVGSW